MNNRVFKNIYFRKDGIIGAFILPILYLILVFIVQGDLDFVINILGPLGATVWTIQRVAFFIGGWGLALLTALFFFAVLGYVSGVVIGILIAKYKNRNRRMF